MLVDIQTKPIWYNRFYLKLMLCRRTQATFPYELSIELFSRRRLATGLAQQSNNNGIMPCMCCIIFSGLT